MAWHRWGNAILSWSQYKDHMIFRFSTQSRRAYTRENPLWGSLLTFLTNELGTECTYIGIIREDLREGMCEEGTGCDQAKHEHNQSCGEAPWVLPAPGKKYAASSAYKPHVKDDQEHSQLPIAQEGPSNQGDENAQGNPCSHHRRLQKIFERMKLTHFLLLGALNF